MPTPPAKPEPTDTQPIEPEEYQGSDADTVQDYDLEKFRADLEKAKAEQAPPEEQEEPTPTGSPVGDETAPGLTGSDEG